jgi:polysaccharide chain length determinant protein (PEP-CTERM system associated)
MHSGSSDSQVDWLAAVWSRRKWLAASVLLLTAAATVAVVLGLPSVYRATATILVEQPRSEMVVPGELELRLQTISQHILSRSRLETMIAGFHLYPRRRASTSAEVLVNRMRRDIRTEFKAVPQPSGLGSTISFALSYRGTDAETVARVANALAALYLEQDLAIRERQTSGTVELLESQLRDVKRDLDEQERALAAFQERHAGELPQDSEANVAALERLHEELRTTSELKARALDRRDELLRQSEAETPASPPVRSPDSAASRLAQLKAELTLLSRTYSDQYPDVVRLKSEIAALERQVETTVPDPAPETPPGRSRDRLRESLAEAETEIRSLRTDEARLRAQIDGYIRRLESAPRQQRSLQEITRDQETTRELYDSLRKRHEQAQLEQGPAGTGASRFRILDPAVVPTEPAAPNRPVLLLVALMASLAVTAAAVAVVEWLDTSFHGADDVRSFTRVPVLASIPRIFAATDVRRRRWRLALGLLSITLAVGVVTHTFHRVARHQDALVSMLVRP